MIFVTVPEKMTLATGPELFKLDATELTDGVALYAVPAAWAAAN